jgi:hypothetical protein
VHDVLDLKALPNASASAPSNGPAESSETGN